MIKIRSGVLGLFFFRSLLGGCVLAAVALFLFVSLCSYSPHDSSFFYYATDPRPIGNVGGIVGAHIAALLFYLLGASSLGLVGVVLFSAYLLFAGIAFKQEWERLGAAVIMMVVCATLCSFYRIDFLRSPFPGGLLGAAVSARLVTVLGLFGAYIFLHTLLLICSILLMRFSFIRSVQLLVRVVRMVFSRRFLVRAHAYACLIVRMLTVPLYAMGHFLKKLYHGSVIGDDEYTVADFEQLLLAPRTQEVGQQMAIAQAPESDSTPATILHDTCVQLVAPHPSQSSGPIKKLDKKQLLDDADDEALEQRKPYKLPNVSLFAVSENDNHDAKLGKELEQRAKILEEKLERFGVSGKVTSIKRGPVVTLFEYQPNIDTKVSKIVALEDDLALALQAMSIRIIAPIPGRAVVGFEVANALRKDVMFSDVAKSAQYATFKGVLPLVLGQDTIGNNVVVDLARMPHLLIAGSTGSGKSVGLNAMLISLLCKCSPDELKLILIDPKRLEFAAYADIAHLLFPVITDSKRATLALRFVVKQMEDRYATMATCGARNVADYNAMVGIHDSATVRMPYIVVVIDELADLMMTASRDIEDLIARVAQMARAAGIHMLVATQRPSVDVITGLIKVNFPSRISFRVTSKIDSRTILDCGGADKLLGRGDMLFLDASGSTLRRVHGAYVSDKEISDVVKHIRQEQNPCYLDLTAEIMHNKSDEMQDENDELYENIILFLKEIDEVSISLLQRKFRIGFNRSARIIEMLESQGLIMSVDGGKTRKVLR